RTGSQLDPELLRQLGLADRALDSLIEPALIEAYATNLDMTVPDDVLDKAVSATLSDPRAADALRERGWTQEHFREITRREILTRQFLLALNAGVQAPRSMTETLYAYRAEQRIANTLAIADSSITDVPTPDDAAIEQFYKANADRYQAPDYRAVTLVRLNPEE